MFEMCSFFLQQSSREQDLDLRTFTNSLETCNLEAQQQRQQTGVVTTRQQHEKRRRLYMFLTKYSKSQIQKDQLNDPDIGPVYDWVKNQTKPIKSEIVMQ